MTRCLFNYILNKTELERRIMIEKISLNNRWENDLLFSR